MKTDIKELPRAQAEITVELSPEEYNPFLKKAALFISEKVKIPGFRPGKAPYDIIKKEVGERTIWEEALEMAVKKTLFRALEEGKIQTVGAPKIDIVKLAAGNPVVYKAVINRLPEIKKLELGGIKILRKTIDIKEESVENQLKELRKMRAKEVLASRPAQRGDKVEVDFKVFLDRVPVEGGDGKKIPLILGENRFIPGFEEKIIGMKSGEKKEFQLTFPKNYYQRYLAGKLADFKVTAVSVYEIELPAMDDALAQGFRFENLSDLKKQLRENLAKEAKTKEERRIEDEILDKVLEKSRFTDIPEILIQSEAKALLMEMERGINADGINFDDYLSHIKKTREELLLNFTPAAARRVKTALLFREIAKQKNISVHESDISEYIKKSSGEAGKNPKELLENKGLIDYIKNVIISQKVLDYLKNELVKTKSNE